MKELLFVIKESLWYLVQFVTSFMGGLIILNLVTDPHLDCFIKLGELLFDSISQQLLFCYTPHGLPRDEPSQIGLQ